MLISHQPLDLSPLEQRCFKLSKETSDQMTRFICKETHNLMYEVYEEFLHSDDYTAPDEDHTRYLLDYFRKLQYEQPAYADMDCVYSVAATIIESGFVFRDILFSTNKVTTLFRLRFVQVSEGGIRSITILASLDKKDYRPIWYRDHSGWVDVTYGPMVEVRNVTLFDQDGTKLSSVRINDLEDIVLSKANLDYPEAYQPCLGVTRVVDVQHELDGTAHVVRNHGYIGDRAVEIIRMDLSRFPTFKW